MILDVRWLQAYNPRQARISNACFGLHTMCTGGKGPRGNGLPKLSRPSLSLHLLAAAVTQPRRQRGPCKVVIVHWFSRHACSVTSASRLCTFQTTFRSLLANLYDTMRRVQRMQLAHRARHMQRTRSARHARHPRGTRRNRDVRVYSYACASGGPAAGLLAAGRPQPVLQHVRGLPGSNSVYKLGS